MKPKPIFIAVAYFIAVIVIAHFFTPPTYDWTQNTISDLGSQGHVYKWIMQTGFIGFGLILSAGVVHYFRQNKKLIVSPLGAVAKISHEFHELARIFLFLFVKIRVIRGKKFRSALERETTKKLYFLFFNVELLLKRKPVSASAESNLDEQAAEARMVEYLKHVPQAAKPIKVRMDNGKPNAEDIARTAKDGLFVRIKLV